uniref:Uncharacterized protein n=1 Tax=Ditylenchus dipsaci TaxID=166011 RepID=A0A915DF85_9BILA
MNQFRVSCNQKQLLAKAEDYANDILRHSKNNLPHVARLFLVSTFIEDSIRMKTSDILCKNYGHAVGSSLLSS